MFLVAWLDVLVIGSSLFGFVIFKYLGTCSPAVLVITSCFLAVDFRVEVCSS